MRRLGLFPVAMGVPPLFWQLAFFIVPLALLVMMTFWSVENYRLAPDFTFKNWQGVFTASYFYDTFVRTLLYSALAAVLASVIAFPVSLYLGLHARPFARAVAVFLLICPFFTSYLVRSYSWQVIISENGILNFLLGGVGLPSFTLLNSAGGMMIGYLTLFLPLVVLLQFASISNIDRDLIQAAHNLRCGRLRTVFEVIIPSARVGLILGATFAFMLAFGDFIAPSILGGGRNPTLSILIIDTVKSASDWPRASVVALTMVATMMTTIFLALGAAYRAPKGH